MLRELTESDYSYLYTLKASGQYINASSGNHRGMRTRRDILVAVLYEYLRLRNGLEISFKARLFKKQPNSRNSYRAYFDCPLTIGEYVATMKYCNSAGFVKRLNTSRRSLYRFKSDFNVTHLPIYDKSPKGFMGINNESLKKLWDKHTYGVCND